MAYRVADLRPGDVLLMLPPQHEPIWDRLFDAAIAWSSGPFVHSALVGDGAIVEQVGTVQLSPLDKYAADGWVFHVEGATEANIAAMLQWAYAHRGQPYCVREILADGLVLDGHDWHVLRDHFPDVTCSGFCERAWRRGGGIALTQMPLPSPTALAFSPRLVGPRPWDRPT